MRAVASVDRQRGTLAKRDQAGWPVRAVDADDRFGPDPRRDRNPEQGMADLDAPHLDRAGAAGHALDEFLLDPLDSLRVRAQRPASCGHRDGDEDVVRKLLGDLTSANVEIDESEIREALGHKMIEARRQIIQEQS